MSAQCDYRNRKKLSFRKLSGQMQNIFIHIFVNLYQKMTMKFQQYEKRIKAKHNCVTHTGSATVLTLRKSTSCLQTLLLTMMKGANQRAGEQGLCLLYCSILLVLSCVFPLLFPVPKIKEDLMLNCVYKNSVHWSRCKWLVRDKKGLYHTQNTQFLCSEWKYEADIMIIINMIKDDFLK